MLCPQGARDISSSNQQLNLELSDAILSGASPSLGAQCGEYTLGQEQQEHKNVLATGLISLLNFLHPWGRACSWRCKQDVANFHLRARGMVARGSVGAALLERI